MSGPIAGESKRGLIGNENEGSGKMKKVIFIESDHAKRALGTRNRGYRLR